MSNPIESVPRDPVPLPVRLRHTIAQLKREVEEDFMDWEPLIARLEARLGEVVAEEKASDAPLEPFPCESCDPLEVVEDEDEYLELDEAHCFD